MIRPLPLLLAVVPILSHAQFYEQNFDGTSAWPLPYAIDTTAGTLWQVGPPQKGLFNAAHSTPNVIVTDTVAYYPPNNTSSFTVKAPLWGFGGWNVFFLRFYHAFDTDTLMEGGYAEVSWDYGATWDNLYEDWMMPLNIENYYEDDWSPVEPDTLPNGQIGYSGRTADGSNGLRWVYSSFCWENIGFPVSDSVFVRFTFYSDSIPEERDGWMIDDITLESYIAHPVSAYTRMDDYFVAVPNPVTDRLQVVYDIDADGTAVDLALYDAGGRRVMTLRDGVMPRTVDHLLLLRSDLPRDAGAYLIAGHIGSRAVSQPILLTGR